MSLAVAIAAAAGMAQATTFQRIERICPIGGEKFFELAMMSSYSVGSFLDTRPDTSARTPWPIPKCPSNGFVMFKDAFEPVDLEKLAPYVQSQEYQVLARKESNYFLAATLMSKLGSASRAIAHAFVKASWEVRNSSDAQRYREAALNQYKLALQAAYPSDADWVADQLLAGELERRLGRFGDAGDRFRQLASDDRVVDSYIRQLIKLQLELIAMSDAADHKAPRPSK